MVVSALAHLFLLAATATPDGGNGMINFHLTFQKFWREGKKEAAPAKFTAVRWLGSNRLPPPIPPETSAAYCSVISRRWIFISLSQPVR